MRSLAILSGVRAALYAVLFGTAFAAFAQQNLGFEASDGDRVDGWQIRGASVDTAIVSEGSASLRLASTGSQLAAGVVTAIANQIVPREFFTGDRIRLAGDIRVDAVDRGYAGIWLRIDGPQGFIQIDDMRDQGLSGTRDWSHYEIELAVPPEATNVLFGAHIAGNGTAWFDNLTIEAYSSSTLPPPSAEVAAYVNAALDLMQQHSIVRESVSWDSFRESALRSLRGVDTMPEVHAALTVLVRRLGDNHSGFITPQMAAQLQSSEPTELGAWVPPAAELVDRIYGYVAVPGFGGIDEPRETRFADEIRAAIDSVASACGWIVDLRRNGGGNMYPMLAGLGPLLGEGKLGELRLNDGTQQHWWYRSGQSGLGDEVGTSVSREAAQSAPVNSPVAVLVGPFTASSGEAVALSFLGAENARLFGMKTRGQTTGNELLPLSDGAMLNLATSVMTDRFGNAHRQGVEPHVMVQEAPGTRPIREQATVKAAVEWLKGLDSCAALAAQQDAARPVEDQQGEADSDR